MQVVLETGIVAEINAAINDAESNNQTISRIIVTEDEMRAFINAPRFRQVRSSDMTYGDVSFPYPTNFSGVDTESQVPRSCVYRGTIITWK